MTSIRLKGSVDAQHRLVATVPESVAPGAVEVVLLVRDDDPTEPDWVGLVAREWHAELADPREDIYGPTDGVPIDGAR